MITAWRAGQSQRQISARLRMSVNTVGKIIATTPGLVEERTQRKAQAENDLHDTVLEWSRGHVGVSVREGAVALGIPIARVRRLLGERMSLHRPPPAPRARFTNERILNHVREWVTANDMSGVAYGKAARANPGWPTLPTVIARFGSWREALRAAGFEPDSARSGPRRRWSDERLEACVTEYLAQTDDNRSQRGLERWLKADPTRPSLSLITIRLGGWATLAKLAEQISPEDEAPDLPPGEA